MSEQHDNTETLVRMANQIAAAMRHQPEEQAVAGIAEHIDQFWTRAMRERIFHLLDAGGDGLTPLAARALQLVRRKRAA